MPPSSERLERERRQDVVVIVLYTSELGSWLSRGAYGRMYGRLEGEMQA